MSMDAWALLRKGKGAALPAVPKQLLKINPVKCQKKVRGNLTGVDWTGGFEGGTQEGTGCLYFYPNTVWYHQLSQISFHLTVTCSSQLNYGLSRCS